MHFKPAALVYSTSLLQIASWSARRAFMLFMPVVLVASRGGRRRDLSACRLHALLPAGAAASEASVHAACMHGCWQELPSARSQCMPLSCIVSVRSCRR